MAKIENVHLSFACPKDWEKMSACEEGKFCNSCQQKVHDFTNASSEKLDKVLAEQKGKLCGRFTKSQLAKSNLPNILSKIAFSVILGTSLNHEICAQNTENQENKEEVVFGMIEEVASPVGGYEKVSQIIRENMKYLGKEEGKVYVRFMVDTLGKVCNPKVAKGLNSEADQEAVRLIKLLKFNPCKHGNHKVEQTIILPIVFKKIKN